MGATQFMEAMKWRERLIAQEAADPFGKGWEPPIWRVCDALLGFPWVDAVWAERMRRHLGFDKPVQVMLVNGGNRGGKSEWASKREMRILRIKPGARGWALHSKEQMSVDYQQPLFWKYMDPALKGKAIQTQTTYVAYKKQTGFSAGKFVLPNLSDLSFLNYTMDVESVEGGNLDIIWNDELVPPDWVETQELRVAEKNGWLLVTFTPVKGYTATVQLFQDGATVVKECTAFLCPKDGGPPDPARALGLTEEELEELWLAVKEKRAARCPQSRPQNCNEWLTGGTGQPDTGGREFEQVPRVMKCADAEGKRAVVFFYSSDNPYGNPKNVYSLISNKPADYIKERFYGFTSKAASTKFPKFDQLVHVVKPEHVPKQGTNYHKVDPSSGRNFFMLWTRVTPEGMYVYREWPGDYDIPGVGVPGPWALPDGKKKDGRTGPAQDPFGFGNIRYKLELARLEGWKDYESAKAKLQAESGCGGELSASDREMIAQWDEQNGAREVIERREMDSRFASAPRNENDRPSTLLTDFEDLLVFFHPAPAGAIADRIQKINDALDYDEKRDVDFYNKPKVFISAACPNLIYSLRTWTGEDGQKGATKDPIDTFGWTFEGENPYVGSANEQPTTDEEDGDGLAPGDRLVLGKDWGGDEQGHY